MKYILTLSVIGLMAILGHNKMEAEYQRGFGDALKSAYKTNPPSDQLEMVCAGLWFGNQNRKWIDKNK